MKDFIKKCLVNYSLIIIASSLVSGIAYGDMSTFKSTAQILLAVVLIHLGQLVTNRFSSAYYLLEVLLEFTMVLTVVLAFGWFFKWYDLPHLWSICTIVVVVYLVLYILDITRTKKDVEMINQQIKLRKLRMETKTKPEEPL